MAERPLVPRTESHLPVGAAPRSGDGRRGRPRTPQIAGDGRDLRWLEAYRRLEECGVSLPREFPVSPGGGYVYFLRPHPGERMDLLKVGSTGYFRLRTRLLDHARACPVPLYLWLIVRVMDEEPRPTESLIQSRLSCHHGEWYRLRHGRIGPNEEVLRALRGLEFLDLSEQAPW